MIQVYPLTIECVPFSDREEHLIFELTKVQFLEWAKENDPDDFVLVDLEHKRIPVVTIVPSRDFITVYRGPVETSVPIGRFRNHANTRKLERVINWYQKKNYAVAVI